MRSTYSSRATVVIEGDELTEAEVDERIAMLKAKLTVLQDAKQQLVARQDPGNDAGKGVRASMLMAPMRGGSSLDVLEEEASTLVSRASTGELEEGDEGNILMARHVLVGHKLGSGFFGDVYQGEWRGIPVAIKFVSVEGADELARESATLDALDHPNVMRLYGLVRRRSPSTRRTGRGRSRRRASCASLLRAAPSSASSRKRRSRRSTTWGTGRRCSPRWSARPTGSPTCTACG